MLNLLFIEIGLDVEDCVVEPSCDGRVPQAAVAQDRRKVVRKPLRVEPPSKDERMSSVNERAGLVRMSALCCVCARFLPVLAHNTKLATALNLDTQSAPQSTVVGAN